MREWRQAGGCVLGCAVCCAAHRRSACSGRAVHRHHPGRRHRLHARELRDVEQVPGGDHGRRRRPARLRQRRPPGRVLHQRREDRRPDAARASCPTSPTATFWNRLYHQNAGRHVHRRDGEGRPHRHAAEPLRHGRGGGRLRQRRLRRPLRHQLRRQHALPQQRGRHVHRRDESAPEWLPADGARAPDSSTTTTTASSTSSSPATWTGAFRTNRLLRGEEAGLPRLLSPRQLRRDCQHPVSQQRRRHVHRRVLESRASPTPIGKGLGVAFADFDDDGFMDVYVANDSVQSFLYPQQRKRHLRRSGPARRASGSTRTGRPLPGWAWTSPTTTTTAIPTSSSRTSRTSATGCFATTATAAFGTSPTRPAWAAPRCHFRAGARVSSTTTTTAGRTSSWRRDT